ncbi:Hypothetical protein D9617_5g070610 [Elsinoe fawcettii]|nr:Hypothetical protein D9617_5g070610 [Elsinoe fawcettii]
MSSRTKLPPKKKGKQSQKSSPESADDFQAAADAEEETGGKWRAGDKAKSCRAFLRAVEIYDRGLGRHPRNFDLAYNKARLEFEVSQQPNLVAKLPVPGQEFLQQALKSHRYALSLNEENTDILFNTSQILVALAELVEDESDNDSFDPALPASWLREALELLDACFSRQEMLFEEQTQAWNDQEQGGGVAISSEAGPPTPSSTGTAGTEQSATVQNAVAAQDLVDTALSSLAALKQLIPLDVNGTQTIASLAENLLTTKVPYCISQLPTEEQDASKQEAALGQASFTAALADAEYTKGGITGQTYLERLAIFESVDLTSTEAQCDYADALIEFASSTMPSSLSDTVLHNVLAKAVALYTQAAIALGTPTSTKKDADGALSLSLVPKINTEQEQRLASVKEAIGDAHLMTHRVLLAYDEAGIQLPQTSAPRAEAQRRIQLATQAYKEAEVSYNRAGDDIAAAKVSVRGVITSHLGAEKRSLIPELSKRGPTARKIVRSMIHEQVLSQEWAELIAG